MNIDLTGQRILVTGAGKGIGRVISLQLVADGAQIVAVSRTADDLATLNEETGCQTVVADLADPHVAKHAAEQAGEVNGLVNNAGISVPQPFLDTTIEALDRTLAVNVRASMVISQVVARQMMRRGDGGAIVNLSSQASMVGLTDHTAYCASKGALDQLTRVMALELGPHRIRVNAVNPTVTLTPMGKMAWSDPLKSEPMLAKIPLGRFAEPEEVAKTVSFLLSNAASMVNGVTLPVDGGFLAT